MRVLHGQVAGKWHSPSPSSASSRLMLTTSLAAWTRFPSQRERELAALRPWRAGPRVVQNRRGKGGQCNASRRRGHDEVDHLVQGGDGRREAARNPSPHAKCQIQKPLLTVSTKTCGATTRSRLQSSSSQQRKPQYSIIKGRGKEEAPGKEEGRPAHPE
jgi:hypothetical protein